MKGEFIVNGEEKTFEFAPTDRLVDVLRRNGHTEVKKGCDEGECGACVILLDGVLVNSCQVLAGSAIGREITTVKGIGSIHQPHPIQQALVEAGAVQCGFCTPGIVLAAYYLLSRNPDPTEDEIKEAISGNLCRCTGYVKIIEGIKLAAQRLKEQQ